MAHADPFTLRFCEEHPADAARTLGAQPVDTVLGLFLELPPPLAARLFVHLQAGLARQLLLMLPLKTASEVIGQIETVKAAHLLRLLDEQRRGQIIGELADPRRKVLSERLHSAAPTVAALIDSQVLTLSQDMSVGQALEKIEASARRSSGEIFVLDQEGRLAGSVTVQRLLGEKRHQPLARVMRRHIPALTADVPLQDAAEHAVWQSFCVAPVTERGGLYLGALPNWTLRAHLRRHVLTPQGSDPLSLLLALAQLYWQACVRVLDLFAQPQRQVRGGARDDAHDHRR